MLQIFRDKAQSTFIQAIVLVIALVFVFWGVGANMMDSRESAIVVNGEDISFQEYQRAYDQLLSTYRQQFGGSVPEALLKSLGLSQQIKTQLIQQALLRQGAQAMGLRVSAPEVQQNIQGMVQFQENGAFNIDKYKTTLQSNRLTPHKFEASMRYDTLSTKGVQAISNFATTVTDAEINDIYQQSKESVSVSFIEINPATFIEQVTVEDTALQTWYGKNKENYKTAPQVKLKFLSFPYDKDNTDTKPATFKEANAAYEGIISAGSLQEYAKQHSEVAILETAFFPRSNPPANIDNDPSIQETAFALKAGELSSLLESPSGYSILFAESIQAPTIPELQIVKKEATVDYKQEEAKILAREKSEEILASLKDSNDFNELSKNNELELKDTTLSRNSSSKESNGFPSVLLQNVFGLSTTKTLPEEPAKVGELFYIYQFTERTLPDASTITDEEKEQFKTQLLSNKQERLLIAWIRYQERGADIFTNKNIE
jgi:peptidyl-prolyl cis-trans isomerase D